MGRYTEQARKEIAAQTAANRRAMAGADYWSSEKGLRELEERAACWDDPEPKAGNVYVKLPDGVEIPARGAFLPEDGRIYFSKVGDPARIDGVTRQVGRRPNFHSDIRGRCLEGLASGRDWAQRNAVLIFQQRDPSSGVDAALAIQILHDQTEKAKREAATRPKPTHWSLGIPKFCWPARDPENPENPAIDWRKGLKEERNKLFTEPWAQ